MAKDDNVITVQSTEGMPPIFEERLLEIITEAVEAIRKEIMKNRMSKSGGFA